jgi:hypothetical protein
VKKAYKVLIAVIVVLVGFRLYLPTLAKNYINGQLNRDPVYQGSVEDVDIHLWRGAYGVENLKIQRVEGKTSFPFIAIGRADVGVAWRDLFKFTLVAKVHLKDLVVNLVAEPKKDGAKVEVGAGGKEQKKKELKTWHDVVKNLIPLNITHLIVEGKSLHFRDVVSKPEINIYLDELHVEGKNLTNSDKVSQTLFGTIHMNARAMKSGDLDIKVRINPIQTPIEMKLTMELKKLNLVELNRFFKAYGKFDVKKGDFSLYSEIAVAENKIEGYAKPLIKNLDVAEFDEDVKKGLLHAFWQQIVELIGGIFKNHDKDRQAARIPFHGRLDDPKVDIWATLGSILKNMFIAPISPSIEHSVDLNDVKKKK